MRGCLSIAAAVVLLGAAAARALCPCANPAHCDPIVPRRAKEVFAYCVTCTDWRQYRWSALTTLAVSDHYFTPWDDELVCYAHSVGVRVVLWTPQVMGGAGQNQVGDITNATKRAEWVNFTMQRVAQWHLDGVNVDFEDKNTDASNAVSRALTALMWELRVALDRTMAPRGVRGQLSFDPVWSPVHSAERDYDYAALFNVVDYLVVMDYVDHQVWKPGPCVAGSDAKLPDVVTGLRQFLALCNVTGGCAEKLVMGIAQSGFVIPCLPGTAPTATVCPIAPHPWRGANCTYLSGHEVPFMNLMAVVRQRGTYMPSWVRTTDIVVDTAVASARFNFQDNVTGTVWQVWMENPATGAQKWAVAASMGLGGVMLWNLDWLNYTAAAPDADDTAAWYDAIYSYTGPP